MKHSVQRMVMAIRSGIKNNKEKNMVFRMIGKNTESNVRYNFRYIQGKVYSERQDENKSVFMYSS